VFRPEGVEEESETWDSKLTFPGAKFWTWKYLAVPIISPEVWGWFVSVVLVEKGQCCGRRRRCRIQGAQNEYFKLQNFVYPKNKIISH